MHASDTSMRFRPLFSLLLRRRVIAIGTTLLSVLAFVILAVSVAASIEAVFTLPPTGRIVAWISASVSLLGFALWLFRSHWQRAGSLQSIAEDVESIYPEFRERLVAGLEFSTRTIRGSRTLADAIIDEASAQLLRTDLRPLISYRPLVRSAVIVSTFAVAFGSLLFLSPDTFGAAVVRFSHPTRVYSLAPSLVLNIDPGSTRIARGDTLSVRIGMSGDIPREIEVRFRDTDAPTWQRDVLPILDSSVVTWRWPHLRNDGEYRIVAGDISSPVYRVEVVERPYARRLSATVTYPAYTEREPEALPENEGQIAGVPGTRVDVSIDANKKIARADIVFFNGDTVALSITGARANGAYSVTHETEYAIHLYDEYGYGNMDPITYKVSVIPDEYPSVRVVKPGPIVDLGSDMHVGLEAEAIDDFGFDRMEIEFRGPDGNLRRQRLPISRIGRGHVRSHFMWYVGEFNLLPEDRITYRVVVWDNDRVSGPKRAESEEYVLRFPSAAEIFAETLAEQNMQMSQLSDIRQRSQETTTRLDALRRELLKTENLTWESRQEMTNLLEQQQTVNQEIARIASELNEALEKLDRHDVLSPETLQKVSKIQELMSELITPELREALRQMQRTSEQSFDADRLQAAMENLSQHREEFERTLERVLNLLREAQADQQLDAMQRRLTELARMQKDVAEQFPEQTSQVLSGRERTIGTQTEDAEEQLSALAEQLRDIKASPSDDLQSLADAMQSDRLAERFNQLAERLRTGRKDDAQHVEAQQLAERLDDIARQMAQTVEERRDQQLRDVAEKIDRAARDLLRLSMMQEDLRTETTTSRATEQIARIGEAQVDLRVGTAMVVDRVLTTAQETFIIPPDALKSLSQTMRSMQDATRAIEQNRADNARIYQQQAMTALNETVIALRQASENAKSSGSSTGVEQLLQQLEQMAQQQQQINDAMAQMQGQSQLTSGDMEMLALMAAQQQALSQMMQQLAGEISQYREILGRFDNLAGEMEEASREIAQGKVGQRLQDRQQRILQRLLDAQRSLSTGKASEERIAETSRDGYESIAPGQLPHDLGEREIFLREAMHEALRADFPPEYRSWIRSYYERLLEFESPRE